MPEYDYLIAGGGIAGLYTAYRLNKKFPSARICILESADRLGGRLHTIHQDNMYFDAGGARFNTDQHRILKLVSQLGLNNKKIAIQSDNRYIPEMPDYELTLSNIFPSFDDFIKDAIEYIKTHNISKSTLENITILEFAKRYYLKKYPTIDKYILARYPYYSEIAILNAKEGFNLFTNEFSPQSKYYILAGGLEQLITRIITYLKKSPHIQIMTNTPLESITQNDGNGDIIYTIYTTPGKILSADKLILALPQNALLKIKYLLRPGKFNLSRMLRSVSSQPLYRIYARYPLNKKTRKPWFADLPKITTNLPIKYIIPMDYEKGLIMISYTDSKWAEWWFNHLEKGTLSAELSRQLKILFPELEIPEPIWFKHCYWDMGAAYWRPGFNRESIMRDIIKPYPDEELYICGENYSSHQAWVEGSLETADMVLEHIMRVGNGKGKGKSEDNTRKRTKKQIAGGVKIKLPEYTLEEVGKHNKKADAWIVIDGIVANITKWIPLHPGGDVIMKGVGKDATQLFHSIGHDAAAKKMLRKYQIGVLKK